MLGPPLELIVPPNWLVTLPPASRYQYGVCPTIEDLASVHHRAGRALDINANANRTDRSGGGIADMTAAQQINGWARSARSEDAAGVDHRDPGAGACAVDAGTGRVVDDAAGEIGEARACAQRHAAGDAATVGQGGRDIQRAAVGQRGAGGVGVAAGQRPACARIDPDLREVDELHAQPGERAGGRSTANSSVLATEAPIGLPPRTVPVKTAPGVSMTRSA